MKMHKYPELKHYYRSEGRKIDKFEDEESNQGISNHNQQYYMIMEYFGDHHEYWIVGLIENGTEVERINPRYMRTILFTEEDSDGHE